MTVAPAAAPQSVSAAIEGASRRTGVDFSYLVATARRESGFDPQARAATSSAAGLFQFIEQTWLGMVKRHGAAHGMGAEARQIQDSGNGRYSIADPQARQRILDMRFDPQAASAMAAEYAAESAELLGSRLGRAATGAELYAAHFLGAAGAAALIEAAQANPDARADQLFPQAARANRSIFRQNGQPATVAQVLEKLGAHHGGEAAMRGGGRADAAGLGVLPAVLRGDNEGATLAALAARDDASREAMTALFAPNQGRREGGVIASGGGARVLSPMVIEALAALEAPGRAKRKS